MRYNIIEKLDEPTIDSKIEVVNYFINKAKGRESSQADRDLLFNYLIEKEKIRKSDNFCVIGPKYALGCLVAHFVYLYIEADISKQIKLLTDLLAYIKGFQSSKKSLLKRREVVNLISLISAFGLPDSFLITRRTYKPLRVYLIPYEHRKNNAVYFPHLNSIASYRPKRNLAPEYIFIHELGHLLAFNLMADPSKVPDSFLEFNKQFNANWNGDLIEIFVDLFSAAVMMETEYASKNPFIATFSIASQNIIKEYFAGLVSDYRINILHL